MKYLSSRTLNIIQCCLGILIFCVTIDILYRFVSGKMLSRKEIEASHDFSIINSQQSYKRPVLNRAIEGDPLSIGGKLYENGIGTHADSWIHLKIHKSGSHLTGKCGITDEVGKRGKIKCKIKDRSKELFISPKISGGDPAASFSVQIPDSRELVLLIKKQGNSIDFNHAAWVDLKIEGE